MQRSLKNDCVDSFVNVRLGGVPALVVETEWTLTVPSSGQGSLRCGRHPCCPRRFAHIPDHPPKDRSPGRNNNRLWRPTMINQTFDNKTWRVRDSQGKYRSIPQHELISAARQCAQEALCSGPAIESALDVFVHLQAILGGCDREVFSVLLLNQNHKILTYEELFVGTVNAASVHPREVVRLALQMNASAVILAHNHPTGSTKPSSSVKSAFLLHKTGCFSSPWGRVWLVSRPIQCSNT